MLNDTQLLMCSNKCIKQNNTTYTRLFPNTFIEEKKTLTSNKFIKHKSTHPLSTNSVINQTADIYMLQSH